MLDVRSVSHTSGIHVVLQDLPYSSFALSLEDGPRANHLCVLVRAVVLVERSSSVDCERDRKSEGAFHTYLVHGYPVYT